MGEKSPRESKKGSAWQAAPLLFFVAMSVWQDCNENDWVNKFEFLWDISEGETGVFPVLLLILGVEFP